MKEREDIRRKRRAFGRGSTVWGVISLMAIVAVMFFVGPIADSKPDKSDFAYGLMMKQRQHGGNPDLNYTAVDRYFSRGAVQAEDLPLGIKIILVE